MIFCKSSLTFVIVAILLLALLFGCTSSFDDAKSYCASKCPAKKIPNFGSTVFDAVGQGLNEIATGNIHPAPKPNLELDKNIDACVYSCLKDIGGSK